MGNAQNEKQPADAGRPDGKRKYRYSVLYTQVLKRWEVTRAIQKALPEGRGTVFYPCAEMWMNGGGGTVYQPLFPGYVFVRSDMDPVALHEVIRKCRGDLLSFIKELHVDERNAAGEQVLKESDEEFTLFDLSEDEAEFLDFILNFRYGENGPDEMRRHKIPDAGVIRMSYGYREGKKYVVMEGPLKGFEEHISDVNVRDRKAYLDIKINGRIVRAGLELKGKKHWFPNDKKAPAILSDGAEFDPAQVARMMMR